MAAEYFVNKQGDDANDGSSWQSAFLTVKKGVEVLQAGDTLTIGPGEYFESIRRDGLGTLEAETTIRAELPGTVVLRGDVPLDAAAFEKVEGYRYVYAADFDGDVQGVNEVDALTQMPVVSSIEELEFAHGSSYYDAAKKRIYISTSDAQPPQEHHYTASVLQGNGLLLIEPRHVTIDGIVATGFQSGTLLPSSPSHFTNWGILLQGARQCVIRNGVAWLNGGGIAYNSAGKGEDGNENGWNLIEKCRAFANGSRFTEEGGNILGFASNHDEIRDSLSYLGNPNGFRFYGAGIRGPALMKNNIGWGSAYTDFFLKGGEVDQYGLSENCISLGILHSANVKNCIIGTINQYNRNPGQDTIYGLYSPFGNQRTSEENREQWFADARNLDFRIQPESPLRGRGPGGADRGAYPYEANIFYVTPNGNDMKDGLSIRNAWKTLAHAVSHLRPGDTLYLEGGAYDMAGELKIVGSHGQTTSIRGRSDKPVMIRGDVRVAGSQGLEFERLNFSGAIILEDCRDIAFDNCRFSGNGAAIEAAKVKDLKVIHGEFTGFADAAIALKESTGTWLSGNLFDNTQAPAVRTDRREAILYSDYNGYSRSENVWRIAKDSLGFSELQKWSDAYSRVQAARFAVENGLPILQNANAFGAGGPHGGRLGFHSAYHPRVMTVSEPHLHSVSDSTANIEWRTPVPAALTIAWGETPDALDNEVVLNEGTPSLHDGFNTLSLTGLKPGTKYYYRLIQARPIQQQASQYILQAKPEKTVSNFTTAEAPASARTLYVATDGNDANSGLNPEQAWKTVVHAADQARAGDTVLIAGGVYTGTARIRASGSPGKPITFRAVSGEKVIFDGNRRTVKIAFSVLGKEYIHFDGFHFRDFTGGGWTGVMDLRYSQYLQITRCFFNAHGGGVPGVQVRGDNCENVLIRYCVITRGFQGMSFQGMKNLWIENNVFLNNLICAILNSGGSDIQVRNNIFVDSIPSKVKVHLFEFGGFGQYALENNAFYLRIPDEERKPFLFYGGKNAPGRMSLAEYEKRTGQKNLIVEDPHFTISDGEEPKNPQGEKVGFLGDWIPRAALDFPDLFTLHPELQKRKIGLLPDDFFLK